MKKIFIAIVALAAATACSNNELVSVNQEAIAFDNAFVNNSTRAFYSNSSLFNSFNVYGFVEGDGAATAMIFDWTAVTGSELNGDWTYTGQQYWINGANYKFHAVAPTTAMVTSHSADYTDGVTLDFTNDGTEDLLYAYATAEGKLTGNTKVAFDFKHLLSKVKFSFVNAYDATGSSIEVKNIKITNAHASAIVALNNTIVTWTNLGGAIGAQNNEGLSFDDADDATEKLLIPSESFAYDVDFDVELYYGEGDNKTLIKTFPHRKSTVTFAPAAGCSYNITATINKDNIDEAGAQTKIEFTVTDIDEWTPTNANDVNLPVTNPQN